MPKVSTSGIIHVQYADHGYSRKLPLAIQYVVQQRCLNKRIGKAIADHTTVYPLDLPYPLHWRRQLWGTGTRVPSTTFQLFNFSGRFRAAQTLTLDFMWFPTQKEQESLAIAKTTARCAQYMGALKSFESPRKRPRLLFPKFVKGFCSDR